MRALTLLFLANLGFAQSALSQADFDQCLASLQQTALADGINPSLVETVFAGIQPRPRVVTADRSQPEFLDTFSEYFGRRINERRIRLGRELYAQYRPLLDRLTRRFGVPGQYVVAFWGLETDFGRVLGDVSVFDSLSTLACEGRRGEYFSLEFLTALALAERGDVTHGEMIGSWAGAMGQTQFMPSNYARYGVDGNGDGRIDLWGDAEDALASAANFLQQIGWQSELRWGREVILPQGFDFAATGRTNRMALSAWSSSGITDTMGRPLPALDIDASILVPSGQHGPAFVVYKNFDVIMRWNRSEHFALTVGHLADRIAGGAALSKPPPSGPRIERSTVAVLQRFLSSEGYDPGPADGIFGSRSRAALRALQSSRGLVADGFLSVELLRQLSILSN